MADALSSSNTSTGFKQRLTISVVLLNLIVYSLVAATLFQSRAKYDAQTAISTQNISTLLEQQIKGELNSIDIGLLAVKHEAEHQIKLHNGMNNNELNRYIKMQHTYLPNVQGIRILDVRGDAILGTGGVTPGVTINLADRDYFIYQRDNPKGDVYFSKPILGRVAKTWIIGMSRRLNNPDGSFAGIIYASIALDHYTNLFSSLQISPNSSITLRDSDMALIARHPFIENAIGSRKVSKELEALIKSGTKVETYKARAGIDNVERLITYRFISGYPLVIIVALAPEDYRQTWRKETIALLAMALFFTFVTVVSRKMLLNRWSREQEIMSDLKTARLALELRSERDRAQAYLDTVETIILALDTEGRISTVNRKGCEVLGYNEEELVGKNWFCCCLPQPDGMESVYPLFLRLMSGEIAQTLEYQENSIITKIGELRHIAWHNSLLRDAYGNITGALSSGDDITDRLKVEEERIQLEKQLLHAQKLESLGVLAGGIAHDFNNILMAIMGNADLALMRINKESPATENLHRIEKAAAQAADLAKQMLAYSGKGKFVIESINLNCLLEDMLHMLEVSISKKAVLRLNLTKTVPPFEADATQLRQIIMNLVINASEAIGDKSGVIAITTGCVDCDKSYLKNVWLDENITEGLYVYLEIADTGCGMDKDILAKIFDPFFTTKFTGRGLGMAAVLGIVRGHKGAIKVYSEPNKGTSFKVLLPSSDKPSENFNGETQIDDWQGQGQVLLVDDEETVRGIGSEMLKELGFTPITANDGQEAVEAYRQNPDIQFIILDLTMPHMDGEQCFRKLRQLNPDVKVIMSSGYNEQEITQKFMGKVLTGFLQKPYKLSVLREAIQKI
jgi:PAS domain S-box-containing protein